MTSAAQRLSVRIRRGVLEQSKRAGVGHIGSGLPVADLLAAIFGGVLRVESDTDPDRDRFILAKRHAALGYTRDVLDLPPLSSRREAFGWDVHEVDGHDADALIATMDSIRDDDSQPHVLLAKTIFGRGVSYMESEIVWHYLPMSDEQYAMAMAETGSEGMRNAFLGALLEIAEEDLRIVLLTGDLGFMVLEPFAEKMPERFINVGVAEQNTW